MFVCDGMTGDHHDPQLPFSVRSIENKQMNPDVYYNNLSVFTYLVWDGLQCCSERLFYNNLALNRSQ